MFCTKCGNPLHDGDKFCAHCGAKVREDIAREASDSQKYEEVVFNPPFRQEAERRTKQLTEEGPYSKEPKKESVHFDWNLDGFPDRDSKKDDDFELNWEAVIERRREPKPVTVEKILPEDREESDAEEKTAEISGQINTGEISSDHRKEDLYEDEIKKEEPLSIADLERELFGQDAMDEMKADEKGTTIQYSRTSLPKEKDQFFTYNAKKDAFQELLDREKSRIEEMESRRKTEWEEITPEDSISREVKEPPKFEEVFIEPETPLVAPLKEVAVVVPPLTAAVMADEEPEMKDGTGAAEDSLTQRSGREESLSGEEKAAAVGAAVSMAASIAASETADALSGSEIEETEDKEDKTEDKEEDVSSNGEDFTGDADAADLGEDDEKTEEDAPSEEEEQPPFREEKEKTKLRYSDVFPLDSFDSDDSGSGDDGGSDVLPSKKEVMPADDYDDDDDEEYKGNKVVKVLIVILAVIVAIELVIIGAKAIAPDSGFSKAVDQFMSKVTSVFTGDDEEQPQTEETKEENSYMYQYVSELAETGDKIGTVTYQPDLKYDLNKTYSFEQIGQTQAFDNGSASSAQGQEDTYGKAIVEAVIGYYNGWQDRNQDENLVGINSLEIGEIRSGTDEYYVLNKITFAAADGSTVTSYQTVRLAGTDNGIIVDEVKEETV